MKTIKGIIYYGSAEAMNFLNMSKSTFYDQINTGKLKSIDFSNDTLVSKEELERFKKIYYKNKVTIDISEILKNTNDIWLKDDKNVLKLKNWTYTTRTKWNEFTIDDLVAYWHYIIKPSWIQSDEYKERAQGVVQTYPRSKWVAENFRSFLRAFEIKYFKQYNILTLLDFYKYLISHDLW